MEQKIAAAKDDGLVIACAFCQKDSARFWHTHQGGDGRGYQVHRCGSCGGSFVHPYPTDEYLDAFYRGQGNTSGAVSAPDDVRRSFEELMARETSTPWGMLDGARLATEAKQYAKGRRFLDIGAGCGLSTRAALDAGFDCAAIEPSSHAAAVFELLNGFAPKSDNFNEQFVSAHEGKFDVVLMSQVLEHIPNPAVAVRLLRRLLSPGGICVIAVPHFGSLVSKVQGKRDMYIVPPEHVNFFSRSALQTLFADNGFECVKSYTVSRFDHQRIKARLKVPVASDLVCFALEAVLKGADVTGAGLILNAVFRRAS